MTSADADDTDDASTQADGVSDEEDAPRRLGPESDAGSVRDTELSATGGMRLTESPSKNEAEEEGDPVTAGLIGTAKPPSGAVTDGGTAEVDAGVGNETEESEFTPGPAEAGTAPSDPEGEEAA